MQPLNWQSTWPGGHNPGRQHLVGTAVGFILPSTLSVGKCEPAKERSCSILINGSTTLDCKGMIHWSWLNTVSITILVYRVTGKFLANEVYLSIGFLSLNKYSALDSSKTSGLPRYYCSEYTMAVSVSLSKPGGMCILLMDFPNSGSINVILMSSFFDTMSISWGDHLV